MGLSIMCNELKRTWEEVVVAYFHAFASTEASKPQVKIVGQQFGAWTRDLPNAKQDCRPLYQDLVEDGVKFSCVVCIFTSILVAELGTK